MRTLIRKLSMPAILLLVLSLTTLASAGPRRPGHGHGGGGNHSVAEPATLALLGAGLASLGIYAKRKHDNKK